MKYTLKLFALLLFIFCKANSQDIVYPVTNYTTKDYGRDFNPVNSAVIQDHRGIIYAANGFKLLEYDGSEWKSYPISRETWILSLTVDSAGIIYTGSQQEFGFFAPDGRGELKYNSLSDSLDPAESDFKNVWKVHTFRGGIVFQAEENLFVYRDRKLKIVKPETSFHTSFVVNDRLFIREREKGLFELKDKGLVHIEGSEIFDTTGIFLMLPFGRNSKKIVIGTREKGFWLFDPAGTSQPFRQFPVEDGGLIKRSVVTDGVITGDGSIALGTMLNGVVIIDTAGRTRALINSGNGLSGNEVKNLISDREQNLWLALSKGISMVGISSPLSVLNEQSGISGTVNTIIRYNGLLYAGTASGLLVQESEGYNKTPFKPAFGLTMPVRSLIIAGGSLIAGTDAGLWQITGSEIRKIDDEVSFTLFYSPQLRVLLSGGGPDGLRAYRLEGSFIKTDLIKLEGEDIIGITCEKNPAGESDEFWLGTRYNGVIRIRIGRDLSFTTDRYGISDGLPEGWVIPSEFGPGIVFETTHGLYQFTDENIVRESLPDSLKNNKDFTKGYFSSIPDAAGMTGKMVTFIAETGNRTWICSDNTAGYIDHKNSMVYVSRPFSGIEAGRINYIYPEPDGICWIGTSDGLVRYDENTPKDYDQNYLTLIRKVTFTDSDSALFMGTGFKTDNGTLRVIPGQISGEKPVLSYANNSIRIEFSATYFEHPGKILYSYTLGGRNPRWSQWTKENFQEFAGLREGSYTFSVKARNIYGTESSVAQFSFTILPPWYRSVPAYFAYLIILIILFWLFARLYSYRLKRENIRLEGIITERTAEVVRQKDEIYEKNIVLVHQKKEIEDSIRYAQRIQSAVLPSEKACHELFPESFVFFRPLNIVSGDFYWISRVGSKLIFSAADCTGHGVPGAFMSMLGVAFLNEIVNKDNITDPDQILNHLREKVIGALQQQGISGETRDGMDIAVVCIDSEAGKLGYAGAYNPLVMIRNGELNETPGDKMPVGFYENMHPFGKHEITVEKGDVIYMFSDGYEDQFGGPDGKKFKSKRLKNLLLEIHRYPMEKQKESLERNFEEWKGDLSQVDDIVVVGLEIK
jgi:serine phosphatase RsbU (regulator of sigma subunit)